MRPQSSTVKGKLHLRSSIFLDSEHSQDRTIKFKDTVSMDGTSGVGADT